MRTLQIFDQNTTPVTPRGSNKWDYKMSELFVECLPKQFKKTFENIKEQIPRRMTTCSKEAFKRAKVDWHFGYQTQRRRPSPTH